MLWTLVILLQITLGAIVTLSSPVMRGRDRELAPTSERLLKNEERIMEKLPDLLLNDDLPVETFTKIDAFFDAIKATIRKDSEEIQVPSPWELDEYTGFLDKMETNENFHLDVTAKHSLTTPLEKELEGVNVNSFFDSPAGIRKLYDFRTPTRFDIFAEKVKHWYKGIHDITLIQVIILEQKFGKEPLAQKLNELTKDQHSSKVMTALKLQESQLHSWLMRKESAITNLGLGSLKKIVAIEWKIVVLAKFIFLRNIITHRDDTIVDEFIRFYGKAKFIRMLGNTHNKGPNYSRVKLACYMQYKILKKWHDTVLDPDEELAGLELEDVFKFLKHSEKNLVLDTYRVQRSGEIIYQSWVQILSFRYDFIEVMKDLFRLKSSNEIVSAMLSQEFKRWNQECSTEEMMAKLKFYFNDRKNGTKRRRKFLAYQKTISS